MKALFVGYGSIAKRHIKNLQKLYPDTEISLCRHTQEPVPGIKTFFSLDDALEEKPDMVFITNPTSLHLETALKVARRGCHMLIEKPLSHSTKHVDKLMKLVREKNLCIMLGYNLRFHKSMLMIKDLLNKGIIGRVLSARAEAGQYLPDWRPETDYTSSYSASAQLGGGVILDLSHEIDYIRWFLGEAREVSCFSGKLSDLEIKTEDTADILLKLESGVIANIHLDYIQHAPSRFFKIIGTEGSIKWTSCVGVSLSLTKDKTWSTVRADKKSDMKQTYIDELKHFVESIMSKQKPSVNELDGKAVLEIALAAKQSSRKNKVVRMVGK
ncbi:MAG: Gfo/Idh/MocA family oxidoreductase [Candidatus Aenigmatarchaeota archaeon]